jgi:hypothetical protein
VNWNLDRIRPGRWYVSGARVLTAYGPGTAKRLVGAGRRLQVVILLDSGTRITAGILELAGL